MNPSSRPVTRRLGMMGLAWGAASAVFGSVWGVLRPARRHVAQGPDPLARKRRILALTFAVATGAVAFTVIRLVHRPPSETMLLWEGVNEIVPGELKTLLGPGSPVVLMESTGCDSCTGSEALQELANAIRRQSGLKIVATESVPRPDDEMLRLPADVYLRVLRSRPDAKAFVSLVGPPILDDKQLSELPQPRPKLVVIVLVGTPQSVKPLVENGLVDLAIVPRTQGIGMEKDLPKTSRGWFDANYQIFTRESPSPA